MTAKILVLAGSTRNGSFSQKTADAAASTLEALGAQVTRLSLADYELPIYNQDDESTNGIPQNAVRLARQFSDHDGYVIATPEYNSSLPPLLKNALDWVSRVSSDGQIPVVPYMGKVASICAASPGGLGGIRVLPHLRAILVSVGAQITSEQVSIGGAMNAFAQDGSLADERTAGMMYAMCSALIKHVKVMSETS